MDAFQNRYGIKESSETENFHRSRRMFCIANGTAVIAEANLPYSHAVWFENMGLIRNRDDSCMSEIIRGFVDPNRNIYFYVGYDFQTSDDAEVVFFRCLPQLAQQLDLLPSSQIFGGMNKQEGTSIWQPRMSFGPIVNYTDC